MRLETPVLPLAALCSALALAACSSGSTGAGGGGGGSNPPPISTGQMTQDIDGKEESVDSIGHVFDEVQGGRPMPPQVAPTNGSATFNGAVSFGDRVKDPDLVADMALTVNFANSQVSGTLWDFHDRAGNIAGGSFAVTGEVPEDAPASVVASGEGMIDWGPRKSYVTVDLEGDLYGSQADWLYGQGSATVATGGGAPRPYAATMGGDNDRVPN
ncbi:hypothetical protein ACXN5S_11445 [Pseudoroseicyclus sp. H15]